ncbi:hypothetical protein PC112_g23101 [Phytophthora cactorum]|nr:hypothetical protein PC112_g23101 [Phytophthora cactorum]
MTSSQRSDTVVHAGITHASSAETSPASAILTPSSDIPAVTPFRAFRYFQISALRSGDAHDNANLGSNGVLANFQLAAGQRSPSRSPRFWR